MSAPQLRNDWKAQLESLEPNWDSYKAKKISQAALSTVGSFYVVPCSDGGIQLEIHKDNFSIEIEINPNGCIEGVSVAKK